MTLAAEFCIDVNCTKLDSRFTEEGGVPHSEGEVWDLESFFGGSVSGFAPVQCKVLWQVINGNSI